MALNGTGQAATPAAAPAAISAGIVIDGNVSYAGDLQISGRVEGDVRGATVFVDEGGTVTGAVEAERLRVCGTVSGTIKVNDLAVESGGVVAGDVSYERLKVATGGIIEGTFVHRQPATQVQAQDAKAAQPSSEADAPLKLVPAQAPVNPRHVFVD